MKLFDICLCMFTFLGDVEMRIPWTARSSNQSILKEINPEYSLERLMLKLKLQHCGHVMRTANSLEKTLCWERQKAEGEESDKGWDGWMALRMQWTWTWAKSRKWWGIGRPGMWHSMGLEKSWTQLGNWAATRIPGSPGSFSQSLGSLLDWFLMFLHSSNVQSGLEQLDSVLVSIPGLSWESAWEPFKIVPSKNLELEFLRETPRNLF